MPSGDTLILAHPRQGVHHRSARRASPGRVPSRRAVPAGCGSVSSAGLGLILRKQVPVTEEDEVQSPDIAAATRITAAASHSSAGWSPYEGYEIPGRITATFVRGTRVYADGVIVAGLAQNRCRPTPPWASWGSMARPSRATARRDSASPAPRSGPWSGPRNCSVTPAPTARRKACDREFEDFGRDRPTFRDRCRRLETAALAAEGFGWRVGALPGWSAYRVNATVPSRPGAAIRFDRCSPISVSQLAYLD